MKFNFTFCCLFCSLFFYINISYCSELYFLCGPDEDGCYEEIAQYCACIPHDDEYANRPYCFNFNALTCTPLSLTPNCSSDFTFANQGECLAMIYQSMSKPPCPLTTKKACLLHNTSICAQNGNPDSCIQAG